MRLEKQQLGSHEQQIVVAQATRHTFGTLPRVEVELKPLKNLIELVERLEAAKVGLRSF